MYVCGLGVGESESSGGLVGGAGRGTCPVCLQQLSHVTVQARTLAILVRGLSVNL